MKKFAVLLIATCLLPAAGCRTTAEPDRFTRIFDGRTAAGWEGDFESTWRIEDGAFVGGSLETEVPRNDFIATEKEYADFILRLEFKLEGEEGFINAGVQIRSQRVPGDHEMTGYQVDLGDPNWWGSIYDESRRNRLLAQSDMDVVNEVLRRGEWNEYEIIGEGRRIRVYLNGEMTVDYTEPDESIPQSGKIGLQVHGGGKALVSYRNIRIEELP